MNKFNVTATVSRKNFSYKGKEGQTPIAVLEGTLALTRSFTNFATGEVQSTPVYLPFQAVGKVAERMQESVAAGSNVLAFGNINYETWMQGDVKHSRLRLKVTELHPVAAGEMLSDNAGDGVSTLRMNGGQATIDLSGNITAEPVVKETRGGLMVSVQIASDERWPNKAFDASKPESKDNARYAGRTHFIPVSLWREDAERFVAQGVGKGDYLSVSGTIQNESWETPEGQKRSALRVHATQFAASHKRAAAPQQAAAQPQVAQPQVAQVIPTAAPAAEAVDMPF